MIRQAKPAGSVENDPGCVKTLGGINAPGILGSTVMRRAKKRKNLSSARHYDQIRFRFHTAKTQSRHRGPQGPRSSRLKRLWRPLPLETPAAPAVRLEAALISNSTE